VKSEGRRKKVKSEEIRVKSGRKELNFSASLIKIQKPRVIVAFLFTFVA
jgi:hypothetical protein